MLKKILLWVFVVLFILCAALFTRFYTLGQASQTLTSPGLQDQQLIPCPDKPNCVNSEFPEDNAHYTTPLLIEDDWSNLQIELRQVIRQDGGSVQTTSALYLAAEYRSNWFGFVDDLEFRYDPAQKLLHIRSASRVGYSDLDVNRERVSRLKAVISQHNNGLVTQ